jgi:hypothetical protein
MRVSQPLDPNEFVDTDAVFDPEYDAEKITMACFTVVPGESVDHAVLVYSESTMGLGGKRADTRWALSLYAAYHYNGDSLPLHDHDAPRYVLESIAGTRDLAEYDWAAADWAYFE